MVNGVRAQQIIDLIEQIAPLSLAEDWDNSGWQVGDPQTPVRSVIVALDLTPEVITEAKPRN
jgi:putative NIF3 family GTP cyclohydrolase 1 type 2